MSDPIKKLLREPLVHFLVLGSGLFVAYSLVSKPPGGEPGRIVVTQGQIASMVEPLHSRFNGLPPVTR